MRTFLLIIIVAACLGRSSQADVITTVDFESGAGYATSIAEFTDGGGDFFLRTDGTDIGSFVDYSGFQGSSYFAAMDIDGEGATLPVRMTITGVDVSGLTDLSIDFLLAEDDDGTNEDWDVGDSFEIWASLDGNSATQIFGVAAEPGPDAFNEAPLVDTDFDGVGDGTEITDVFQDFNALIAGSGSTLDLEFIFDLNSGDEDIAIDNIRINGFSAVPEPSSLALVSLAGLGLVRRRSRRS